MHRDPFTIRPITPADRPRVARLLAANWGASVVVSRGVAHHADRLPGFIAEMDGEFAGLATYHIHGDQCELVTLDSLVEGRGIGTALIAAVRQVACAAGCARLWLVTTNDNFPALGFYQKRGFRLIALYPGAIEESRKHKPTIPLYGIDSIPIRDEIELALDLP